MSSGPIFGHVLGRSTLAPTIKAIRETVAMKGVCDNQNGRLFLLWEGVRSPYGAIGSPYGGGGGGSVPLQASFQCFIGS